MPWEVDKHKRTLLIERLPGGRDGRDRFAVSPFCIVTTDDGTTYSEPLPNVGLAECRDALRFDRVEFIDPPNTVRTPTSNILSTTHRSPDYSARSAKASAV